MIPRTLPSVYRVERILGALPVRRVRLSRGALMAVGIAIAMFVALFGWGSTYFGWSDPEGKIQLALATSFILGIIGGYKAKG